MSYENEPHLNQHSEQSHESESMPWLADMEQSESDQQQWMEALAPVLASAHNQKQIVTAIVHTALHMRGLEEHAERLTPIIAEAAMADKAVLSGMLKLSDQVLKQTLQ